MSSLYLSRLAKDARAKLEGQLWEQQGGKCFISERSIDLKLDEVDVDPIIPTRDNGKDDPSNFAITLAHFNRSKQAADLRVARVKAMRSHSLIARSRKHSIVSFFIPRCLKRDGIFAPK